MNRPAAEAVSARQPGTSIGVVHIVFGPQGAGKSTYARQLAHDIEGVRFSIDDWMSQLYGPDLPQPLNFAWVMERVRRCEQLIWATAAQVARCGGHVVLDLGFMKVKQRQDFVGLAEAAGLPVHVHFIDAPHDLRKQRVLARNAEQGETFAFEVTPAMFEAMEREFERPTDAELSGATVFNSNERAPGQDSSP